MQTKETVIEIKNLKKSFGNLTVLNNISLQLHKEENLVILGKSGSGKSVLIKCIVQLLQPDEGTISVFGNEANADIYEIRKKIGFLFQSGALYDSMTVKQNLEFPLRRLKKELSDSEIDAKVLEALENVGLEDVLNQMPSQLSGGMKKRISLARTIIIDPEIILYDEPTTGLDPVTADEISTLINDIQKKFKTASIIITHDIECVRTVADRIIMIKDGEVYKEGTLAEFEVETDKFISSFFKTKKKQYHGTK
jgi:phospholipid/cholesterol/gamma-HCH transport system ATP-binding protein